MKRYLDKDDIKRIYDTLQSANLAQIESFSTLYDVEGLRNTAIEREALKKIYNLLLNEMTGDDING